MKPIETKPTLGTVNLMKSNHKASPKLQCKLNLQTECRQHITLNVIDGQTYNCLFRTKMPMDIASLLSTTSIKLISLQVFKKLANPGVFLIYFRLLKHLLQFLTTNKCEKCPSIIRCQDSNSQPLEHESPPITTRPPRLLDLD